MKPFEEGSAESPDDPATALPAPLDHDADRSGSFEEREITVSSAEGDSAPPRKIRIQYFTPHFPGWSSLDAQRTSSARPASVRRDRAALPSWARAAALFVVWLVVLGTTLAMSGGGTNEEAMGMPDEFLGVWRTVAPKYEDNFIEISRRELRLGTDDEAHAVHDVARLTRAVRRDGFVYTLWYVVDEDPANPHPLSFYYSRAERALRLRHQQDIVWNNLGQPPGVNDLVRDIAASSAQYERQYGDLLDDRRGQEDGR